MVNIMSNEFIVAARLDGYLSGVIESYDLPRDISANTFIVNVNTNNTIETTIKDFYSQTLCDFSGGRIFGGYENLQEGLEKFLLDEVFFNPDHLYICKLISIRILEYVEDMFITSEISDVFKFTARIRQSDLKCIYFCLIFRAQILVIQFRDRYSV